jgi:gluconate kinase
MGRRNFLIDGASGTGKTTVANELQRRGYHAVHGDRELAYRGDPETGEPTEGGGFWYWVWDVAKVEALVADHSEAVTFFCGGSRNSHKFIDLLDDVFVLELDDLDVVMRRIAQRVAVDPTDCGATQAERDIIVQQHETNAGVPDGRVVDASMPIERVVDEILRLVLPHGTEQPAT